MKHRRQVAIKAIHPEMAAAIGHDRFLREIEIAAQLNHPHVLPFFDSGAADGQLFYVMPYLEGETLRARLKPENIPRFKALLAMYGSEATGERWPNHAALSAVLMAELVWANFVGITGVRDRLVADELFRPALWLLIQTRSPTDLRGARHEDSDSVRFPRADPVASLGRGCALPSGYVTLAPGSQLPDIVDLVVIDGTTQWIDVRSGRRPQIA